MSDQSNWAVTSTDASSVPTRQEDQEPLSRHNGNRTCYELWARVKSFSHRTNIERSIQVGPNKDDSFILTETFTRVPSPEPYNPYEAGSGMIEEASQAYAVAWSLISQQPWNVEVKVVPISVQWSVQHFAQPEDRTVLITGRSKIVTEEKE